MARWQHGLVRGLESVGWKVNEDRAALVSGNNQFAFDLYGQLRSAEGNLFFSPYSISAALGMTYGGARNQTAEQMARTLHFTLDNEKLHSVYDDLLKEINGKDKNPKKRGYQLSTANALWAQKGYPFLPEYLKMTRDSYGAGQEEVDFAGATEAARKTINTWVEKETNDKIKELLKEGILTTDTRLVLTNAIYFKGDWKSQFKKDVTKEETFHVSPEKDVKAPLMHQTSPFKYFQDVSTQVLELPYVGDEVSLVVLLPRKVDGLAELEKSLTAEKLAGWVGSLREQKVVVTLPKFKTTREFQLKKALSALGMPLAFSSSADFSGLDGMKGNLQLADVIHKAFVDVNEEGTEAAATTAVVVKICSIPPPAPVFRADHPFVFVIRDRRSESVLFLGRMVEPQP